MALNNFELDRSALHSALTRAAQRVQFEHVRAYFDHDPKRIETFFRSGGGLSIDFSKNKLDQEVLHLLLDLAREAQVETAREAQLRGDHINVTEDRAVLHTALRSNRDRTVDGQNIKADVDRVKAHMQAFTEAVRSGSFTGYTGRAFTDVVNIGIGGSDLGPAMVCQALEHLSTKVRAHFVSNVDGADLASVLRYLNPETTLFIVVSKTFTTQETLANAEAAKQWVIDQLGDTSAIARHFAAVSTNLPAVEAFGIQAENAFGFWDWVGGRYSLWGAVGLVIALSGGWSLYEELLNGAEAMDNHFESAPLEENLPVLAAIIGVWYRNYLNYASLAVIPYSHALRRFPAYLQQADMESNGKTVDRNRQPVRWATGPIVWGEPGTNGQHAFFQLLHQGSDVIPVDFIAVKEAPSPYLAHHQKLLANCFAQSEALMMGQTKDAVVAQLQAQGLGADQIEQLAPYKVFDGNRPSTTILLNKLDGYHLGSLIAFFEHKIFVQGILWGVYSYDQWGVELGKALAKRILPAIENGQAIETDPSTHMLLAFIGR
jgi:glucose-6-phosphate isomerase